MNNGVKYCPPAYKKHSLNVGDYPVDVQSSVPPLLRGNNPQEYLQKPLPNGGLFSGPEPAPGSGYEAIYVPANSAYYINQNLRSVDNMVPGSTTQYVSISRSSNNMGVMPGVYWLNDDGKQGSKYPADGRYMIRFVKNTPEYNGGR